MNNWNGNKAGDVFGSGGSNLGGSNNLWDSAWNKTKAVGSWGWDKAGKLGFQTADDGSTKLWGMGGDAWNGIGTGLYVGSQLANAWSGMQNVKLGKEQFKYSKDLANRNLANQSQLVNNQIEDRQRAENARAATQAAASGKEYTPAMTPEEARKKYGVTAGGV
jgi:hypothetical protein